MKYDSENNDMSGYKWYVSMTDSFMSGWGKADRQTNKLIFGCNTLEEAEIVEQNANNRTDQKYVSLCMNAPTYNKSRYYVQFKTKHDYPTWYKAGSF